MSTLRKNTALLFALEYTTFGLSRWLSNKESACNARETADTGSIPGSGRSSGGGDGNPVQYSCLGNPMEKGAWWATVHGVAKSWAQLSVL